MSIKDQCNIMGKWLEDNLEQRGVTVECMANMRHLWERIYDASVQAPPMLLLVFASETSRGGFNERNTLSRVDREWNLVVLRGHGFKHAMNETVPKEGLTTAFYDDVEAVRQLVRRCIGISAEPIDYVRMAPLPGVAQPNMANVFLDGYVLTYTTASDIPQITLTNPASEP